MARWIAALSFGAMNACSKPPPKPTPHQQLLARVALAPSTSTVPAPGAPEVVIARDGLYLGDNADQIAPLREWSVDPSAMRDGVNGLYITPLANRLDALVKAAPASHKVIMRLDREMPYRLLVEAMYTAGQSNFEQFCLLTAGRAGEACLEITAPHAEPAKLGRPTLLANPVNLTVSISEKGFTLAATGAVLYQAGHEKEQTLPTLPLKNGAYDLDGLAAKLREIKTRFPDELQVVLVANPQIPWAAVAPAIDRTREDAQGKLFPKALLAAGVF
jgi:biopolymer transport protein ExbD